MSDECHGALDLSAESLDFTHGFSWTLQSHLAKDKISDLSSSEQEKSKDSMLACDGFSHPHIHLNFVGFPVETLQTENVQHGLIRR